MLNQIILTVLSLSVLLIVYYGISSNDSRAGTQNFMNNVFMIILPIVIILCFTLLDYDIQYGRNVIVGTIIAIALFLFLFYFLTTTVAQYIFNKYLFYIIVALIVLIGLTIIVTVVSYNERKKYGWLGFFYNLLFYIPCLIRDTLKGITAEYTSTPNTIFILFVVEIVLLLMYFFLLPLVDNIGSPENITFLNEPVMLNRRIEISHKIPPLKKMCKISDFKKGGNDPDIDIQNQKDKAVEKQYLECIENKLTESFSISMWVYVNPSPKTKVAYTKPTPIFSYYYTDAQKIGKIPFVQLNLSNQTNARFSLNVDKTENTTIPMDMPLQRWNNVVLNYTVSKKSGENIGENILIFKNENGEDIKTVLPIATAVLDVFINGKLTNTIPLTSPWEGDSDFIAVGDGIENKNLDGVYGSICNVVYYKKPLTKLYIVYNYNRLVIKNPPLYYFDD